MNVSLAQADRLGVGLSLFCLLHCLTLGVGLVTLPIGEGTELLMLLAALGLAITTFSRGFVRHRRFASLALLFTAILLFSMRFLAHDERLEVGSVVAGCVALAIAHHLNCRSCQRCTG